MKTHLKGFGLENFRVFKDYTWFDFAPITILTGPNNSGKSSLLNALLLLKDNFDKGLLPPKFDFTHSGWSDGSIMSVNKDGIMYLENRPDERSYHEVFKPKQLIFDGNIHGLNSPSNTKSRGNDSNQMYFEIPYDVNQTTLIYKLSLNIDSEKDEANAIFKIEIFDSKKPVRILLKVEPDSILFDIKFYNEIVSEKNKILAIPEKCQNHVFSNARVSLQYWFLENQFDKDSGKTAELAKKVLQVLGITENFDGSFSCETIKNYFNQLDFWASSDNEQKRIYSESDSSKFKQLLQDFHKASQNLDAKNILEDFAKEFGIKGQINSLFEREKGTYFLNIDGLALTNFGYGYTQLLSLFFKIIVHADKNREAYQGDIFEHGSTLMLEEPEVNLHPNLQSKLADLFASASKQTNTQFLIETHSEYMIRKFQYLVLKDRIKAKDVLIYYFKDPNDTSDEPLVKKINIQKDGRLTSGFGKGFLDETGRLMASLLTGEYLN